MAKPATEVPSTGAAAAPAAPVAPEASQSVAQRVALQQNGGIAVMPVYDLNGRPLGFFPLAPGVDPSVLHKTAIAPILPQATAPSSRVPTRSPILTRIGTQPAVSSPLAALPAPGTQPAPTAALAPTASTQPPMAPVNGKPAGALAAEAAIEAGKASLLAAFELSLGAPGPGAAAGAHTGPPQHALPRSPRAPKDARTAPKDVYVAPTPVVQVTGGDVAVPSGPRTVTAQTLVPVRPYIGGGAGPANAGANADASALESKSAGGDAPGPGSEVFIYSLEGTADALAELQEAKAAAEARVKELDKKLRSTGQKATLLEKDLAEAYKELDGREAELRAMKAAERAASKRPDLLSVLKGSLPGTAAGGLLGLSAAASSAQLRSPLAPVLAQTSTLDRARMYELLRRVPVLASLPDSILWELLHHSKLVRLHRDGVLAQAPGEVAQNSLLVVTDGTLSTGGSASSTGAVLACGDYFCEHNILGRQPRLGRDPASWLAVTEVTLLAVPAELLRRFLLSECAVLDSWSEAAVAALVAPNYTPTKPQPRLALHADADATALHAHVQLHSALRHVATGEHIRHALERMASAARARATRHSGMEDGHAMHAVGHEEEEDDDGEGPTSSLQGTSRLSPADRAIASIPPHLAQNAPLLLQLLTAALPGVSTDRMLEMTALAAGRFFDCAAVALVEFDTSAVMMQEQMAQAYGSFAAAKAVRGGGPTAQPVLIHRLVPPHAAAVLNRPMPLSGFSAVCVTSGSMMNIRDTAVDTQFNDKLEPVAGPMGARTLLYVPIFTTIPSVNGGAPRQQLCGVLQLIDKRRDTSRYFSPSTLRDDEEVAPGSGGAGEPSTVPLPEEDVTVLDRGVVARGSDGKPRYVFSSRDEELAELVARRLGDIIGASLRQAVLAEAASSQAQSNGSQELAEEEAAAEGEVAAGSHHDAGKGIAGLGEAAVQTKERPSAAAHSHAGHRSSAPKVLAQHRVADVLQWRVRALHATQPLSSLVTPVAESDGYGYDDYGLGSPEKAGAMGGRAGGAAGRPATSVLNLPDDEEAEAHDRIGALGDSPGTRALHGEVRAMTGPGLSPTGLSRPGAGLNLSSSMAASGLFGADMSTAGLAPPALALPPSQPSLYVYVRAVLVMGRSPIVPDVSSPSARCLNGHVSGRLGNGYVAGAEHGTGYGGSGAETCTAHWGVGIGLPLGGAGAGTSLADDPTDSKGWMDLPARVCDIPRGCQLVLAVHEDDSAGPGRPLFWTAMPLFSTSTGTLRTGRHVLPLQPGPWPGPALGAVLDECGPRAGMLEVDLGSVGVPSGAVVVDCDAGRGARWWRSLTMLAGLKLDAIDGPGSEASGGLLVPAGRGGPDEEATELILEPTLDPAAAAAAAAASSAVTGRSARYEHLPDGTRILVSHFMEVSDRAASLMGSAAKGALGAAGMHGEGVDPRHSEPSRVPALQSGVPALPMSRPPPSKGSTYTGGATPASMLPLLRVSPGVQDLSPVDLAVAKAIMASISTGQPWHTGGPVPDVWTPHKLSEALRKVLWTYRRPILAAGGVAVLPLLLKSAPFMTGLPPVYERADTLSSNSDPVLALRAALSLLRSSPSQPLPAHVALQLLDATFAEPGIRAAGAASLLMSPAPTVLSLAPVLSIVLCGEPSLDSALTRLLFSAVAEAPRTLGRQLLWALRSIQGATGYRARVIRLLRALLDSSHATAGAEDAVQSFGLTQLASVCRRGTLAQSRGNRTASVQAMLSTALLPHTVRLPLRAHVPVVPSCYYRAIGDGSLASALTAKLTGQGEVKDGAMPAPEVIVQGVVSPNKHAQQVGEPQASPTKGPVAKPQRGPASSPDGTRQRTPSMASKPSTARRSYDDDEDDEDESLDGERRVGEDAYDDEDGEEGEGEDEEDEAPRDPIREVEEGMALAMVQLGAYSDSPAFRLPTEIGTDPAALLQHCKEVAAVRTSGGVYRDPRLPTAGQSIHALLDTGEVDSSGQPTMPLPYTAAAELAVQRAKAAAEAATEQANAPLTAAQRLLATQRGTRVTGTEASRAHIVAPSPTGTALPAGGLCVGSLQIEACRVLYSHSRKRYSRTLLVFKVARDLDDGVGSHGAGAGLLSDEEDPFPQLVKHTCHVPRPLRWRNNAVHVLGITGDDVVVATEALHAIVLNNLARIWREAGMRVGDAQPVYAYGVHSAISRDPMMGNAVSAGAATSQAWSSVLGGNSIAGGGVPLASTAGESVGGRLFGLLLAPPFARSLAEILGVGEEADDGPSTATGHGHGTSRDAHFNDAATVIDDAAVVGATRGATLVQPGATGMSSTSAGPGFGRNGLQRWFMANLYNVQKGGEGALDGGAGKGASAHATDPAASSSVGAGQYETIVRAFATSLAGAVVGSYVLALGERKPADILITPAGHLMMAGIGFADGMPDKHLHVDEAGAAAVAAIAAGLSRSAGRDSSALGHSTGSMAGPDAPRARFASKQVLTDLLAVMGGPSTTRPCTIDPGLGPGRAGRLGTVNGVLPLVVNLSPLVEAFVRACVDAFMAARARAQEFITIVGMHTPLALPGASSPYDLACLRSRLLLHLPLAEARARAAAAIVAYLGLEPTQAMQPVPVALPATTGVGSFARTAQSAVLFTPQPSASMSAVVRPGVPVAMDGTGRSQLGPRPTPHTRSYTPMPVEM